ncbi:MAG TPA: copper resistance protein CopC [Dehalococcoidia bacterium]|nr:copper resistance protein CopC [Dehalococcoidia bacterium]
MKDRRRLLALIAGLLIALSGWTLAAAQTGLTASEPPAGQIVTTPPDSIRLWLEPPVEPDRVRVHVTAPSGRHLESGPPRTDPAAGPESLVVPLAPSQEQGWYAVEWMVAPAMGTRPPATPVSGRWPFGYSSTGSLFEPPPDARGSAASGGAPAHGGHAGQAGAGVAGVGSIVAGGTVSVIMTIGAAAALVVLIAALRLYRRRSRRAI